MHPKEKQQRQNYVNQRIGEKEKEKANLRQPKDERGDEDGPNQFHSLR